MAEQLTAENLESYSIEAISNYGRAIEDFSDVLVSIKSEDANVSVFNSLYIMIEGKKRRLYDLANVDAPEDPMKLEVMVYSRENIDIIIETIDIESKPLKCESEKPGQNNLINKPNINIGKLATRIYVASLVFSSLKKLR